MPEGMAKKRVLRTAAFRLKLCFGVSQKSFLSPRGKEKLTVRWFLFYRKPPTCQVLFQIQFFQPFYPTKSSLHLDSFP